MIIAKEHSSRHIDRDYWIYEKDKNKLTVLFKDFCYYNPMNCNKETYIAQQLLRINDFNNTIFLYKKPNTEEIYYLELFNGDRVSDIKQIEDRIEYFKKKC